MLLSYRRAKAVASLLLAAGVLPQQIVTRAYGAQLPLPEVQPAAAKNRRVTIRVAGMPACFDVSTHEGLR